MDKRAVDKPEIQKLTLQQIINGDPSAGNSTGPPRAGVKDYIESVEPVVDSLVETFNLLQKYTLPPSKDLGRAISSLKQKTQAMQEVVAARNELICMLSAENVELLKQLQALRSKKSTGIGRISATALKRAKVFSGSGFGSAIDSEHSELASKARSSIHELDQELTQEFAHLTPATANKAIQVERWSSTIFEEIQGRGLRKQADIKKLNEIISILTQEPASDPLEMLGKRRTPTD